MAETNFLGDPGAWDDSALQQSWDEVHAEYLVRITLPKIPNLVEASIVAELELIPGVEVPRHPRPRRKHRGRTGCCRARGDPEVSLHCHPYTLYIITLNFKRRIRMI